jgi:hypothetical protein
MDTANEFLPTEETLVKALTRAKSTSSLERVGIYVSRYGLVVTLLHIGLETLIPWTNTLESERPRMEMAWTWCLRRHPVRWERGMLEADWTVWTHGRFWSEKYSRHVSSRKDAAVDLSESNSHWLQFPQFAAGANRGECS